MKNEVYYTIFSKFVDDVRKYVAEIDGTVICADKVPYIGFVVYNEKDDLEGKPDTSKHFLIDCKYVKSDSELVTQAFQSLRGRENFTKALGKEPRSWAVYETIGIGIPNPRPVVRWTGPPEELERLVAVMVQSGMEVDGLTEEEMQKYLKMEVDV